VGTTTTTVRAACTDRPYGGRPGHPSFRALHRLVVAAACGDPPRRHLVRTTRCEEPPHHARACTDVAAPSAAAADARPDQTPPRSSAAVPAAPGTRTPATRTYKAASERGVFRPSPTRAPRDRISLRRRLVCKCTGARRLHPPTPRRHGAARCEGIAERDASAARYPDPHRTGLVAVHLITCSGTRAPKTRSAMGDRPRPAEPRTTWLPAAARPDDGHHHLHRHAELLRVRARSSRRRNSSCRAGGRDALPRVRTRVTTALTPLASTGKCHAIHQFACTVIPPHNS
jgi:hypothetical protein